MADTRLIAVRLLIRMEADGAYSNILLDGALSEQKLSPRDRAFVSALFYGVCERRMTLDHIISCGSRIPFGKLDKAVVAILRAGLYQLLYMPSVPESAAVNESVKLCAKLKASSAGGFVNGMLRGFIRKGKKIDYTDMSPSQRMSIEYSCPSALCERLTEDYGAERAISALEVSLSVPPLFARVNMLKTTPDDLVKELRREGTDAEVYSATEGCVLIKKAFSHEKSRAFRHGLFHIQDLSSQLCCYTLRPVVNETVLDVCSAPGGKAFTMAQLMGNRGRIIAMDLHENRLSLIGRGAARLGLKIIETAQNDAREFNPNLPMADRVLCDVPCSGFGIIRRKPEIKYKDIAEFGDLPAIQLQILETSARYVKVGGTMVYSTCTLSKAENEGVIAAFSANHPEFSPIVQTLPKAGAENSPVRTFFPEKNGGDGFFTASFRRTAK